MKLATYDNKTSEVSSPMDAYIKENEEADKELNLEKEVTKDKQGQANSQNNNSWPTPTALQQQVQTHSDNTVSTFWEKQDVVAIGSDPKGRTSFPAWMKSLWVLSLTP